MPRINTVGQEHSHVPITKENWHEVQSMILENLDFTVPEEWAQIREDIKKFIEERREYVRKNDQRNND